MKKLYNLCILLMIINNNVYTFTSGILISLSTNIFTSLCFDHCEFIKYWNMYLSTVLFAIASAMCIFVAVKITGFQNYISNKNITNIKEKIEIIKDVTQLKYKIWIVSYIILFISVLFGTILLAINY